MRQETRLKTQLETGWQHEPEVHLGSPVRGPGQGKSGASRMRLARAIKTYCWQHTDSIHSGHRDQLYSSILWKVHLLFLSFPLKLHSCAYGKKKKKWKCTLKRCIKSSTHFLCLVMFCLNTSLWKDLASFLFLLFWGRGVFVSWQEWEINCLFFFFLLEPLHSKFRYMNMFRKQSMRTVHRLQCYFFYQNNCIKITFFPEGITKQFGSSVWENQEKCNNMTTTGRSFR